MNAKSMNPPERGFQFTKKNGSDVIIIFFIANDGRRVGDRIKLMIKCDRQDNNCG